MELLLVHSPLVGPSTWRFATALSTAGHHAVVPDLRSSALAGRPLAFVDEAVSSTPSDWSRPVVVGHSGAGFLLPSIADGVDAAHAVFVDAGLPPENSPATAGADILDRLRGLAIDGTLPRWPTWWGDDVMKALVPDDVQRAQLEAELPEVPIAFYEVAVELPTDWPRRPSSFLLLSDAYRADAERASSLGWRVTERLGGHLDIVTAPRPSRRSSSSWRWKQAPDACAGVAIPWSAAMRIADACGHGHDPTSRHVHRGRQAV